MSRTKAADGREMRVNFEVTTESTRPILSLKKGADSGAITIFKPHGGGRTTQDKKAIWNITKILDSTQDSTSSTRSVHTSLTRKNCESSPEQYVQPVIRNDRRGQASRQAAKEHERKRKLESEGFETNLDQPDRTTPNQPTKTPRADSTRTDGARADKLHLQSEVRDLCGW